MKRALAVLTARAVTGALFVSGMALVAFTAGTARGGRTYPTIALLDYWPWLGWIATPWLLLMLLGPLTLAFWPILSWVWNMPITPRGVARKKEHDSEVHARMIAAHKRHHEKRMAEIIAKRFGETT